MLCSPGVDHGIVLCVPSVAGIKAFGEHGLYALFECVEVRDRWRGRSVVGGVILGEFAEIKVVSTIFDG